MRLKYMNLIQLLVIIIISSTIIMFIQVSSYKPYRKMYKSESLNKHIQKMHKQSYNFRFNYSMNNIWRANFLLKSFTRIYISDTCSFAYFTTLKTASKTTRQMIDIKQCDFGYNLYGNVTHWRTCGDHRCSAHDYDKILSSKYYNIIFTRNPIDRFESNYNFLSTHMPIYYQNMLIPKDVTNDMIKNEKINRKHLLFLRFIQFFEDIVLNKTWKELGRMRTDHLQPIYLYACVRDPQMRCFIPSFVGKVETLMDDIHWLDNNHIFGNTKIHSSIYSATHVTPRVKIPKGTIYKYKNALFTICRLYWNDFYCGNYEIPFECQTENAKIWHFPTSCIDGSSDKIISWPTH
eukprot:530778_1